ncbi:MAG: DNA primase [Deltaproteobacteria bacterium]|nr:DNA primase [Deltaproteobacteria bacterium]
MIKKSYINNIPQELKDQPYWVAWRSADRGNGKIGKIPINPATGITAKTNDPSTWGTFDEALACCQAYGLDGIGFVFAATNTFVGIDFDDCRDPATGEIAPWALEIIKDTDSYTEISPSGEGLHIFAKGKLPGAGKNKGSIEIYDSGRFFTVTGNILPGTPTLINNRPEQVNRLYLQICNVPSGNTITQGLDKDDSHPPIKKSDNSTTDEKFNRLWSGDHSAYPSQSEADLALCRMLANRFNNDPIRIDQSFRQSGLYGDKWDRPSGGGRTYGQKTIDLCLNGSRDTGPSASIEKSFPNTSAPATQVNQALDFKLTDLGNAERLVALHGDDLRYCGAWRKWLVWDGNRWTLDNDKAVMRKAQQSIRHIYVEAAEITDLDEKKKVLHHAMKSESERAINASVNLASVNQKVQVSTDSLDTNPWLLACLNGTIDLHSEQLLPPQRDHLITQLAPVAFDPDALCDLWLGFLAKIMNGNKELISFLQRAVGYALTGDTGEQCLFILYGSGCNGKSTFLQTINQMLGDYAKQTPTETLLVKQRGAIPNDVARLKGSRFVTASEAEEGQQLAESLIKQMTGGDKISARFFHQEFFDFQPTHKIFLGTNHRPIIKGTDHAIWRRIRLIPFEVTIPEAEIDRSLPEKLKEELPGILAWAVRGCISWQKDGLGVPEEVKTATSDYQDDMDTVAQFIDDCCTIDPEEKERKADIYKAYLDWSEKTGNRALVQPKFSQRLTAKGMQSIRFGKNRDHYWQGLALNSNL